MLCYAIQALQLELLHAGVRMLREDGSLVYSTCSFARGQNEDVVSSCCAMQLLCYAHR
jgi:16S rRNA C967 or C1407 C5-methylase (RsmB/RsmF family)